MSENNPGLSIVVPCYNESKNIPLLLEKLSGCLSEDSELILVDNGSTDNTREVLSSLIPEYPFARVVTVEKNIGYGYGIVSGLRAARGDFLAWTHADLQTDPGDVIKAYNLIKGKSDPERYFIKGARKSRPVLDEFFTRGMSLFSSIVLGKWITDINAQPKLFHSSFIKKLKNPPNDWALDQYVYFMAKKTGLKVETFPVDFSQRLHGKSHWNTGLSSKWKLIKRTMNFTLRLRKDLKKESQDA